VIILKPLVPNFYNDFLLCPTYAMFFLAGKAAYSSSNGFGAKLFSFISTLKIF